MIFSWETEFEEDHGIVQSIEVSEEEVIEASVSVICKTLKIKETYDVSKAIDFMVRTYLDVKDLPDDLYDAIRDYFFDNKL